MLGLPLALCSSLCWGVSDFVGGLQARTVPLLRVLLISQSFGLECLAVILIIRGAGPPAFVHVWPAIAAGLAGTAALAAFYRALAIGSMSIVAPISATGVAVPVVVGIAQGERPAAIQLAGIVAASIGVVLASRERSEEPSPADERTTRITVLLALIAAAGFGSFFVGLRSASHYDVLWALFASRGAGVAALLVATLIVRPPRVKERWRLLPLSAVAVLDLGANGLYAVATRHGLLAEVAVGSSLYPLATVVLARIVLGERVHRLQEVGIAVAIAGVAMIAAG
ncbi:MAG TPA: EamA family transporter [Solirubrobacteraceae bacterium]|nr:EamA family transporter [Solirubrobacteraceae bacterium]